MPRRVASLSLDLDNKWSYLKTHGDPGWDAFPSYLDVVVPRVLEFLKVRDQKITFFVVGQDAALEHNHEALASLSAAGHEIGNHSFHHEPWLHLYSEDKVAEELARAEEHLERVTGQRPVGFRGPGFSISPTVLRQLSLRGYEYDCSTFPTFLGPLARAYYFFTAKLDDKQKQERKLLFGRFREGFRPLKPYAWDIDGHSLVEVPVTTMPLFKVPIHVSYVLYLASYSRMLAVTYWRSALAMCRLFGVAPSLLLHPLDFMGGDDDGDLRFFPAMNMPWKYKVEIVGQVIDSMRRHYDVRPMREHVRHVVETVSARPGRRPELVQV